MKRVEPAPLYAGNPAVVCFASGANFATFVLQTSSREKTIFNELKTRDTSP